MTNQDKLTAAFARGLDVPEDDVSSDMAYETHGAWDSVAHMALVAEIEDAFDIMLDTDDVIDLSSFTKACELLDKHGINTDS